MEKSLYANFVSHPGDPTFRGYKLVSWDFARGGHTYALENIMVALSKSLER